MLIDPRDNSLVYGDIRATLQKLLWRRDSNTVNLTVHMNVDQSSEHWS